MVGNGKRTSFIIPVFIIDVSLCIVGNHNMIFFNFFRSKEAATLAKNLVSML
jgi:hypothetical protein